MTEMDNQNSIFKVDDVEKQTLGGFKVEQKTEKAKDIRIIEGFTTFEVTAVVPNADAQNAQLYPVFYVASVPCFFLEAKLRHSVNSTSGTVDVEKLTSGTAKGSGTSVLSGTFSIAANANITQSRTATIAGGSLNTLNLIPGDALALKAGGTLTNASNVVVGVLLGVMVKDLPTAANI